MLESKRDIDTVKKKRSITSGITHNIVQVMGILCMNNISGNKRKAMKKSKRAVSTRDMGIISRGKYIFLIRLCWPVRLFIDWLIDDEKKVQGNKPAKKKTALG
jgi:hypothetical protein